MLFVLEYGCQLKCFFSRFNCSMVYDAASIWMMFLFMLEKLHGPLNHLECSHDAATSGRVKSLFFSGFQFYHSYMHSDVVFHLIHLGVRWSDMRQSCVSN